MIDFDMNVLWMSKEHYAYGEGLIPHTHTYNHYIYVLDGLGKISINGVDYDAEKNFLFLTHKDIPHSLEPKEKNGMNVIEIKFDVSNRFLKNYLKMLEPKIKPMGLEIRYKLENLIYEGMKKGPYYKYLINLRFLEIIFILLRQQKGFNGASTTGIYNVEKMNLDKKTIDHKCLNDTIIYIKNNLNTELRLEVLANIARMSKYRFCRFFKENIGVTPTQYINNLRISHAKNLLTYSDLNVTQIAFKIGFNDARYFSRIFKQSVGITPSVYSRKNRPNLYFYLQDRIDWET